MSARRQDPAPSEVRPLGAGLEELRRRARATALLRPEQEVELGLAIEVGVFARERLESGQPLTASEVDDLGLLVERGGRAFEAFVTANLRMVLWASARRARFGSRLGEDELALVAMPALVRAVHKWDYRAGWKFSTYAMRWISQAQGRAEANRSGLPLRTLQQLGAIRRVRASLTVELQRIPTPGEVSAGLGLSERRIAELEAIGMTSYEASLDQADERRPSLLARVPSPDAAAAECSQPPLAGHELEPLLEVLSTRERKVVELLFGLAGEPPMTLSAVATRLRVPVPRVTAVRDGALVRMRNAGVAA